MLKILKLSLIAILSLNLIIPAVYADDVTYLTKDDHAPYSGYLFSPDLTKEYRALKLEYPLIQTDVDSLKRSIQLQDDVQTKLKSNLGLCMDQNDKLESAVTGEKGFTDFERMFWFTLGVLATGLAVYGASQLKK